MSSTTVKTQNKSDLLALHNKAKLELRNMEVNLSKNFSKTLLNNCYDVKKLLNDLENLLGTENLTVP